MILRAVICMLIALWMGSGLVADPRLPDNPTAPAVEIRAKNDSGKNRQYAVTVISASGVKRTGSLALAVDSIEIAVAENGTTAKKNIPLSAIDSIEFLRWQGSELRKNEYVFYPVQIKFILTDKNIYASNYAIKLLNKLSLQDAKGTKILYSYFYDYRKKNVWQGSGESDVRYPETNPHGDTVVRIVFIR